jgi:preprotein translocase subunit SecG
MQIVRIILNVVFVIVALMLIAVVLIQEGKGGGFGNAFGGVGGEVFGHGATGVNKLTSWLAGTLLVLAMVLAKLQGM